MRASLAAGCREGEHGGRGNVSEVTGLDVVAGRQQVFDGDAAVIGYRLVFRHVDRNSVSRNTAEELFTDERALGAGDSADRLAGGQRLFCRATQNVLAGSAPLSVPADRVAVEVPAALQQASEAAEWCDRLHKSGYEVVLDGFSWFDGAEPLLQAASAVVIDRTGLADAALAQLIERCHAAGVKLVADHVDTAEDFDRCRHAKFDWFTGFLLAKYRSQGGKTLDAGRLARLRMSTELLNDEFSVAQIEAIVRTDPAMTHQLLQLAAIGAPGGLKRNVRTIREALVLVGWRRLQSWLALLMLTDGGGTSEDGIAFSLYRARMVEMLAGKLDKSLAGPAFMVGMLSSLDVLLGAPLDRILVSMSVADELRDALLTKKGQLGLLVADVTDFQLGRAEAATRSGLTEMQMLGASLEALRWAVQMTTALEERPVSN